MNEKTSKLDQLALRYVLLARGKMHAIDVAREDRKSATHQRGFGGPADNVVVGYSPGTLRGTSEYRNLILVQAAGRVDTQRADYVLCQDSARSRVPASISTTRFTIWHGLWERNETPGHFQREKVRDYLETRIRAERTAEPSIDGSSASETSGLTLWF